MTVNPYTVELVIRGDLDTLRTLLDRIDPAPRIDDVEALRVAAAQPARCGEQHPHYGWTCALPEGHTGRHDPEPSLPAPDRGPETAEGVEDAPVVNTSKETPVDRGEAVKRPTSSAPLTGAQKRMMFAAFGSLGYTDEQLGGREERLQVVSTITGRRVESTNDLTKDEASTVVDTLARAKTRGDLENLLDAIEEAHR